MGFSEGPQCLSAEPSFSSLTDPHHPPESRAEHKQRGRLILRDGYHSLTIPLVHISEHASKMLTTTTKTKTNENMRDFTSRKQISSVLWYKAVFKIFLMKSHWKVRLHNKCAAGFQAVMLPSTLLLQISLILPIIAFPLLPQCTATSSTWYPKFCFPPELFHMQRQKLPLVRLLSLWILQLEEDQVLAQSKMTFHSSSGTDGPWPYFQGYTLSCQKP